MAVPATSYDTVLYPSFPFQQTHPARTAAVARLHGVPAASPARCRVLELGAGDGANLIPLAAAYPDSEFVGVDLAPTPVAKGNATIAALGLKNARLHAADIRAVGEEFGAFDFVIAHGVFSWVPEEVRHALLAVCEQVLTPAGVAYVSFNAYPGCHIRRLFWEVAKFHTAALADPGQKIQQAKAVLHFLAEGITARGLLGQYMREEARHVAFERPEAVLFHDDLAGVNQPYYFHEFAALAGRHGLQFLAEADVSDMENDIFPPAVAERLRQLGEMDVLLQEQYRDFLQLRRFRQTLLVREETAIARPPTPDRVRGLSVAIETRPDLPAADLAAGVAVTFKVKSGAAVTVDHPFAKAALLALTRRWPHPVPFPGLLREAEAALGRGAGETTDRDREVAAEVLLAAFEAGVVLFFADPPGAVEVPGDRPRLSPLARHQIEAGGMVLTNLLHLPVKIEDRLTRRLLWSLDGTRDRAAVAAELARWAAAEPAGDPAAPKRSEDELRADFAARIDDGFAKAAELALLVG